MGERFKMKYKVGEVWQCGICMKYHKLDRDDLKSDNPLTCKKCRKLIRG